MLFTLIQKELLNNLLNLRIALCYILIFVLMLFSILTRGLQYEKSLQVYHRNIEEFNKDLDLDKKATWEDRWWVYDIQIKPSVLSIFCEGYNKSISRPYHVDHNFKRPPGQINFRNPVFEVFKVYDLALIMALVMSLLVIFVSYDSLSGERENRTMGLVMANRVSKSTFLLGKFLGGYLSIIIPFLLSLVFSLAIVSLITRLSFTSQDTVRLLFIIVYFCLYAAVFFCLSILCSIIFRSSSFAMLVLIVVWIGLAFIVPFGANYLAKSTVPVMSLERFIDTDSKIYSEERKRAWKEYRPYRGTKREEVMSIIVYSSSHKRMSEQVKKMIEKRYTDAWAQKQLETWLARISPVSCFLYSVSSLARTGLQDFYRAHQWKMHLKEKTWRAQADIWIKHHYRLAELDPDSDEAKQLKKGTMDLRQLPSRTYQPPGLDVSLKYSLVDLLLLGLEAIALFMVCFLIFIRKSVNQE